MERPWARIVEAIRSHVGTHPLPSVSEIARDAGSFHVLISTMISLRTKDDVTLTASRRLFSQADSPRTILRLPIDTIAELIYPAGFYRTKARHIHEVCSILVETHAGEVPSSLDALVALPGVGRKTANLVLGLGFGIPAICVDTHVHRIANRCGWVESRTPEETERLLAATLPRVHWIEINELLVAFGQRTCTPLSPHCSSCPIVWQCERREVTRAR